MHYMLICCSPTSSDLAVMANIATGIDPDLFKAQINRYGGMAVRIWKFAARRKWLLLLYIIKIQ